MKKIMLKLIELYQKIPGNFHYYCKHTPTCSTYAKEVIRTKGAWKGTILAIRRIITCNPFSKGKISQ